MNISLSQLLPMSHSFEIREGAIVVSDVHFSHKRKAFFAFLQEIESGKIVLSQLILMGDIFDLLFGQIAVTHLRNKDVIDTLNRLSKCIDIHYLEGNHDYALKDIFPNIAVYPLSLQPLTCKYKNSIVKLAHGDFNISKGYGLYAKIIRLPFVMYLLNCINYLGRGYIIDKLDEYLDKKEDCNDFKNFESYVNARLEEYKSTCDVFVEGHFHQNKTFKVTDFVYINVAAFACYQRYFIVKSSKDMLLELQEAVFKEI